MVNYLTLDILIYLHMIMKYILKKTKIKQLSAVKNGSSRIAQTRVRLATDTLP